VQWYKTNFISVDSIAITPNVADNYFFRAPPLFKKNVLLEGFELLIHYLSFSLLSISERMVSIYHKGKNYFLN